MENADYREVCKRLARKRTHPIYASWLPRTPKTAEQLRMEKNCGPVELSQFAEAVLHLRRRFGLPCE